MNDGKDQMSTPISKAEANKLFGPQYRTKLECRCGCVRSLVVGCDCECHEKDKRITRLEAALREIEEHPHLVIDKPSEWADGHEYGHRCCAEIARKSLEGK